MDPVASESMGEFASDIKTDKVTFLSLAYYIITKKEKARFCRALKSTKVFYGYSSNIKNFMSMKDSKL